MTDDQASDLMLTYAELGTRLGIGADGARFKARRMGWPVVQANNNGKARVRVPAGELPERPPEQPRRSVDQETITSEMLTELRRANADRAAELIARAERAEQEAERWRSEAEQSRSEAERHHAVADLLREQIAREITRGDALADELRELRRPWWRRLIG